MTNQVKDKLSEIKKQFNLILKELKEESERLKTTYPIFDLLAAKQAEVERMKKTLSQVNQNHPDRKTMESMVKSHIVERDELRRIAQKAEERLSQQLEKINASYIQSYHEVSSDLSETNNQSRDWVRIPEY